MDTNKAAGLLEAARPVAELCRGLHERNFRKISEQLAPDVVWTIVGRPDRFQFGGPQNKTQFLQGIQAALPTFEHFSFEVLSWARNDAIVFIEAQVDGRGPGTLEYTNRYLVRFITRDGLITSALEHYDPFEALAFVEQLSARV